MIETRLIANQYPVVKVRLDAPTLTFDGHTIASTIEAAPEHFVLELPH